MDTATHKRLLEPGPLARGAVFGGRCGPMAMILRWPRRVHRSAEQGKSPCARRGLPASVASYREADQSSKGL